MCGFDAEIMGNAATLVRLNQKDSCTDFSDFLE